MRELALVEIEVATVRVTGDIGRAEMMNVSVRELLLAREAMRLQPNVLAVPGIVIVVWVERAADLVHLRVRMVGVEFRDRRHLALCTASVSRIDAWDALLL
jgi:hypothetical protein